MRNVKLMAKDKARKILEETVSRIKKQFQRETLTILVEFDNMREQLIKKDKEVKAISKHLILQENDIMLKNTRLVAHQVIDCNKELNM